MDFADLEELHKLCPKITYLSTIYNEKYPENFEIILKFEELTSIYFNYSETKIPFEYLIKFLKSLKDNKLKSINFPELGKLSSEKVNEFYETLFSKVNLTSFERLKGDSFSFENTSPKEQKIIASWIEKNSTVESIQFNCNTFSFSFKFYLIQIKAIWI
jgi:hypothetical protein